MKAHLLILVALLAALPARGATSVGLKRADDQPERILPYRAAVLSIENDSDRVIRAIRLRWQQGGPAFIHPVALAPHTSASITVKLPPIALQQAYTVALHQAEAAAASPAAELVAEITWKLDDLTTEAFLDAEAYDPWHDKIPAWPEHFRRNVFIAGVLYCLVLAACLLIRRRVVRLAAVAIVAVAAGVGVWTVLSRQEFVFEREVPSEASATWKGTLVVLTCRRTTRWHDPDPGLIPIYYSKAQMAEDSTVIHATRGVRVTLSPGEVRLFRRP